VIEVAKKPLLAVLTVVEDPPGSMSIVKSAFPLKKEPLTPIRSPGP